MDSNAEGLTDSLEAALLRELHVSYRYYNASLFGRALVQPVMMVSRVKKVLARWNAVARTMEFSWSFIVGCPWLAVMEVLKHEMAHQYVDEVLKDTGPAHGAVYRDVCARYGIDAAASGVPAVPSESTAEEDRILARVSKLLALAGSANVHEAHAAASAAQRLMLRYNIDAGSTRGVGERQYGFRQLGKVSRRIQESERLLSGLLAGHFFVDGIWVDAYDPLSGHRGCVLEICGTRANLDMTEYVYEFMIRTADALWEEHKKATGTRGNRERQTFVAGVMLGFRERMESEKVKYEGEGLVWVKDAGVKEYIKARYPHRRTIRRGGNARTATRELGKQAGRDIVLRKPMSSHGGDRGRLLSRGS